MAANFYTAICESKREDWYTAGKWLAFTAGTGFLPLIIGLLLVWGLSQSAVTWHDFIAHGEFAIYSATLVAGSARLISKDIESGPFVHREMFIWAAIVILTLAVSVYSLIKAATFLSLPNAVNTTFIIRFTLPLFFLSLLFSFFVVFLDHQRFSTSYSGAVRTAEKKLEKEVDELREQGEKAPLNQVEQLKLEDEVDEALRAEHAETPEADNGGRDNETN